MSNPPPNDGRAGLLLRIDARSIADAEHPDGSLGASVLLETGPHHRLTLGARVLVLGPPERVDAHPASAHARRVSRPDAVLIPALVNAHTHLDLTRVGPLGHNPEAGFVSWIDQIRARRPVEDPQIARAVADGARLSLAGGVAAVGDIAGSPGGRLTLAALGALRDSDLVGVSYLELFGIGAFEEPTRRGLDDLIRACASAIHEADGVRFGLQPHAPNTVSIPMYHWIVDRATALNVPLSTHLAESPEERRFVAEGTGSQRDLLERVGVWDDSILDHVGRGRHPVEHLEPVLARARFLVAHANDAPDRAIRILAQTGTSVAYCPRASAYFGAASRLGPHRYRRMLEAGINVCLGTDSIASLPSECADPRAGLFSTLAEARLLYRRDGTDPATLLAMATTNGATALGLDPDLFRFTVGRRIAGVVAVAVGAPGNPVAQVLAGEAPPVLI